MDQRRILIADTGEEYRMEFIQKIRQESDLLVVGQTGDGHELLRLARSEKPDVIVMDMILTGCDGVEVLDRLPSLGLRPAPRVLVVTSLATGGMAQLAASLGADHYMTKPCRPGVIYQRIRQLCALNAVESRWTVRQNLESTVTDILQEIGMSPRISGYNYLRDAIVLVVHDQEMMRSVTKVLYPAVARGFHSTGDRVERSMRHAIEQTWKLGDPAAFRRYFGPVTFSKKGRPSNSEFIARIADRLQQEMGEH